MTLPLAMHDPRTITLELPIPPSANAYWRSIAMPGIGKRTPKNPHGWGARVLLSREARVYAQNVKVAFHRQMGHTFQPLAGPIAVHIIWRRERRAGDVSNRIKVVEDALKGLAYVDDKQVVALSAERRDGETPGLTVRIQELP